MSRKSCVYWTTYSGDKLPPSYIGSAYLDKLKDGYCGSVSSQKYKDIWERELLEHPELFEVKIISEHDGRDDAYREERRIQLEYDVVRSDEFTNRTIAGSKHPHVSRGYKRPEHSRKNISKALNDLPNHKKLDMVEKRKATHLNKSQREKDKSNTKRRESNIKAYSNRSKEDEMLRCTNISRSISKRSKEQMEEISRKKSQTFRNKSQREKDEMSNKIRKLKEKKYIIEYKDIRFIGTLRDFISKYPESKISLNDLRDLRGSFRRSKSFKPKKYKDFKLIKEENEKET